MELRKTEKLGLHRRETKNLVENIIISMQSYTHPSLTSDPSQRITFYFRQDSLNNLLPLYHAINLSTARKPKTLSSVCRGNGRSDMSHLHRYLVHHQGPALAPWIPAPLKQRISGLIGSDLRRLSRSVHKAPKDLLKGR